MAGAHRSTFNVDPADPAPDSLSKDRFPFCGGHSRSLGTCEFLFSYPHLGCSGSPKSDGCSGLVHWDPKCPHADDADDCGQCFQHPGKFNFCLWFQHEFRWSGLRYCLCAVSGIVDCVQNPQQHGFTQKNPVNWRKVLQLSELK